MYIVCSNGITELALQKILNQQEIIQFSFFLKIHIFKNQFLSIVTVNLPVFFFNFCVGGIFSFLVYELKEEEKPIYKGYLQNMYIFSFLHTENILHILKQ